MEPIDMFDPDDHVYRDETGRAYDSVTTIIGEYWPIDKRWFKDKNANFGTEVHEATALIDWGQLEIEHFSGTEVYMHCHAWKTFLQRLDCELLVIEQPAIHRSLGFGFTADRVVRLPGGNIAILDIKTGAPAKWHELQLGAYSLGVREKFGHDAVQGFTVHLQAGKVARPVEHDIRRGANAFWNLMMWRRYRGMF